MVYKVLPVLILLFSLIQGSVHAETATVEFNFLERLRDLREHPDGPKAREDFFALGEYYFQQNDLSSSADYFKRFDPKDMTATPDMVALAHLAQCTQEKTWRLKLEEAAVSRPYFALNKQAAVKTWTSPLGNLYEFRDAADRVEILQNGKLFYAVDLS